MSISRESNETPAVDLEPKAVSLENESLPSVAVPEENTFEPSPRKKMSMKKMFPLFGMAGGLFAIVVASLLVRSAIDLRSHAATSSGTAQFLFTLPSGGTTLTPSSQTTFTVQAVGTGLSQIDGYQLIATLTGSVPSTVTFTPATITGLSSAAQSVTDISNGKKLTIAFITSNPQMPYSPMNGAVTLGTISLVAPTTGTLTITIDQQTSKILQSVTGNDLLALQNPLSFPIVSPATPTATATTNPTVSPVPTSSIAPESTPVRTSHPSPTVSATASPTPTATATASPTPTATATPSPTPTIRPTATATVHPSASPTPTVRPSVTPAPTVVPTPRPTATPVPNSWWITRIREFFKNWRPFWSR